MNKGIFVSFFLLLGLNGMAQVFDFERIGATSPLPTNVADFERTYYNSVVFADVDNDGDEDVLVTGRDANGDKTARLYKNNGLGSFKVVQGTPFEGVEFSAAAFADVDGDNDQDVVIAGTNSNSQYTTKLYKNDGAGNFSLQTGTSFTGVRDGAIAFADVDGDNDQDLLITGWSSNGSTARLYRNNGSGAFSLIANTPFTRTSYSDVVFEDLDGDNDLDLIIAGMEPTANARTRIYRNNGNGSFSLHSSTALFPAYRSSIALADIDGDNDLDVLLAGLNNSGVRTTLLYTNNGNLNFSVVSGTNFDGVQFGTVAFSDMDGDNDQDIFITGHGTSGLVVGMYTNNGTGSYTKVNNTPFRPIRHGNAVFSDIDGDNDEDLLIIGNRNRVGSASEARLYMHEGGGLFELVLGTPFEKVYLSAVSYADVDGDNDLDVFLSGALLGGDKVSNLYLNDGTGIYSLSPTNNFKAVDYGSAAFADVDGDGDQDLLYTGRDTSNQASSLLYTNNGSGVFTLVTGTPFTGVFWGGVAFSDIDGDGDQDVMLLGRNTTNHRTTELFTNNGSGVFSIVNQPSIEVVSTGSLAFADIDGDGDDDLLVGGYNNFGPSTKLYTNNGAGVFTPVNNHGLVGGYAGKIIFEDLDGDNDLDVLLTGRDANFAAVTNCYRNNGTGAFTLITNPALQPLFNGSADLADVDGDNDLDLLISGVDASFTRFARFYTNKGNGVFSLRSDVPFSDTQYGSIAFGDIDSDGDPDVITTGSIRHSEFISRLYRNNTTPCQTVYDSMTVVACDAFFWQQANQSFQTSGIYYDTLQTAIGCDSISILDLTVNPSSSDTTFAENCYNYTWSRTGQLYTSSGYYYDTLTNQFGCDSLFVLDLIINPSQNDTANIVSCGPYIWQRTGNTYATSGTYYDVQTDAKGCDSTGVLNLTVHPTISSDAGVDVTACLGNSSVIGGNPTGPAGATYNWSNATTLNSANISNPIASPTVTTIYHVTVTDANSCTSVDSMTFFINPRPNVDAGPSFSICSGQSVTIGGSPTSSTVGAVFQWDNGSSLSSSTAANPTASPATSTLYTVTVADGNGCTAIDTMSVSVTNINPVDSVNVSACAQYTWAQNGQTYFSNGAYSDTVTVSLGCDSIMILNLTIDTVNTSISQTGFTLTVAESGAQYQWYHCDSSGNTTAIQGATSQSFTATSNGNYSVQVIKNSCSESSNCIPVVSVGIASNEANVGARIYPNPNNGNFIVELNEQSQANQNMLIYDARGKLIENLPLSNKRSVFKLDHLAEGIYFVQIGTWTSKLMIR